MRRRKRSPNTVQKRYSVHKQAHSSFQRRGNGHTRRALGRLGTLIRNRIVPHFHCRISAGCAFQTIARGAEWASGGKGSDVNYLPLRCGSPAVKLRPAAALLVPVLLSNPWREQPYRVITYMRHMLRSITHQHVLHSLCCGAFSRDYLVRGNGPLFLQEAQYRYERSANVSFEAPLQEITTPTFGRKDGCSSITELFRNFCTRQSLP
jgi:hypothetical protein